MEKTLRSAMETRLMPELCNAAEQTAGALPGSSGRLKVLYVVTRADRGGAQVHVTDLLGTLRDRVEPVIASGEDGFLCDEARRSGIRFYRMKHLVRPIRPWTDIVGTAELAAIIRREKPDLVHAHTSKAGLLGRAAAALTKTPIVFTVHSWSFVERSSWVQNRVTIFVERVAARLGGPMIMVSESNRRMALAKKIGRPKQLITVRNGVPDTPHRARHGHKRVPQIIMAARFVPQKDHATLLHALSGIESPWKATLAGSGPLLAVSQTLAQSLGIADRVAFIGTTDRIEELLAQSDIFVLSSFFEGLPLSVLEAMRAGLPVLATDTGGTSEAITNGVTGYLTGVGDHATMRMRLRELIGDATLRAKLGAAARSRYELEFRLDSAAAMTFAVYRTALGAPGADEREIGFEGKVR